MLGCERAFMATAEENGWLNIMNIIIKKGSRKMSAEVWNERKLNRRAALKLMAAGAGTMVVAPL